MKRLLCSMALCMTFVMQPAQATFVDDCNTILNAAQQSFADIFPGNPPNQFFGPWCYRTYQGELLAGITSGDSNFPAGVYVLGGFFGNTPTFIGSVSEVFALLGLPTNSGGRSSQEAICDNSNNETSGIVQTQEGNKVKITTNGKCIKPPENNSFCEVTPVTDDNGGLVETGIHALTTTTIDNVLFTGSPGIPEFSDPLDSIVDSLATKTCIIHAPEQISDFEVETDICMDLTDQIGIITGVTAPVTLKFKGLSTVEIVNDCFQTDAETVTNLVTQKVSQKINGVFVQID